MAFLKRHRSHGRPCPYCKRAMESGHPKLDPSRDHLIPKSREGRIIVVCCVQCNTIKADMSPADWDSFMVAHPRWWLLTKGELRVIRRAPRPPSPHTLPELIEKFNGRATPNTHRRGSKIVVVPPELIFKPAAERFEAQIAEFREAVERLWPSSPAPAGAGDLVEDVPGDG